MNKKQDSILWEIQNAREAAELASLKKKPVASMSFDFGNIVKLYALQWKLIYKRFQLSFSDTGYKIPMHFGTQFKFNLEYFSEHWFPEHEQNWNWRFAGRGLICILYCCQCFAIETAKLGFYFQEDFFEFPRLCILSDWVSFSCAFRSKSSELSQIYFQVTPSGRNKLKYKSYTIMQP